MRFGINEQHTLALQIIDAAFKDKTDLSGKPYVDHLHRVASNKNVGDYKPIKIAALLHDLLEDCSEWSEKSLSQLFDSSIVKTVVILTRSPEETYDEYIERLIKDYWATNIKIADLEDNLNLTRLNEITDRDVVRIKKYIKAYKTLTSR